MPESVSCPECGQESWAAQRFCGFCGATLGRPCPTCGERNALRFRFCGRCGASLAVPGRESAGAMVEERRWATVLFADLSGFTTLSERTDPEDLRAILDRCLGRMGEAVERGGGRVTRLIGDEVVAVFGAPVAHGNDAERAVSVALEIQAADVGGRAKPESTDLTRDRKGLSTNPSNKPVPQRGLRFGSYSTGSMGFGSSNLPSPTGRGMGGMT